MRADYHAELIDLEELFNLIWSVAHDVVLLLGVSNKIWMHAKQILSLCGVTPKQVHRHLLHSVVDLTEIDLQWTTDLLNVFEFHDRGSEASIDAEDTVVSRLVADDGTEWKPLEKIVHLLEDTVGLIDVFAEAHGALFPKAEITVHFTVLVIASQEEDLLRVFQFEGQQEAKYLQTLGSSINVVT